MHMCLLLFLFVTPPYKSILSCHALYFPLFYLSSSVFFCIFSCPLDLLPQILSSQMSPYPLYSPSVFPSHFLSSVTTSRFSPSPTSCFHTVTTPISQTTVLLPSLLTHPLVLLTVLLPCIPGQPVSHVHLTFPFTPPSPPFSRPSHVHQFLPSTMSYFFPS